MPTNLNVFIKGLNAEIEAVRKDAEATVRKIAFAIDRELVRRTPVGNPDLWRVNQGRKRGDPGYVGADYTGGRARANWLPSIETPATEVIDKPDPTGASSLTKMAGVSSKFRLGQRIFISNNLPYIRKLAYENHSKQAPSGWIEGSIQTGIKTVLKR